MACDTCFGMLQNKSKIRQGKNQFLPKINTPFLQTHSDCIMVVLGQIPSSTEHSLNGLVQDLQFLYNFSYSGAVTFTHVL